MTFLKKLARDNLGTTAIEYGLIVSLICLSSLAALETMANENTSIWGHVKRQVTDVMVKPEE